jgi:type IV pilus assembly protein PilW
MTAFNRNTRGVSLIELMVALAIGSLLVLGLVEVFAASRTAYQMSEGMARVQENSRFAIDYLQRDLRMGGHFGCVNDQSHQQTPGELQSHFENVDGPLQFNVSVQGYEANGTAPGNIFTLPAPAAGTWTPALPAYIKDDLSPIPKAGSDIVVLRYLSSEGVPVTNFTAVPNTTTIQVDPGQWTTLTSNGVANPKLFGIADCNYADIFEATTPATGTLVVKPTGLNKIDFTSDRYSASPPGQVMLYRAESVIYYVAPSAGDNTQTSLWRARYITDTNATTEELVEGVESLQILYGRDARATSGEAGPPMGYVDNQTTADVVDAAGHWQFVGLIRIGILAKSPNKAAAQGPGAVAANRPNALGVSFATPTPYDGNYRTTYESTIALRNRLYGN